MDKNELMAKARAAKAAQKTFENKESFKKELMEPIQKKAKNVFSADIAKAIAAETKNPIEHIFKEIKYAASWGKNRICWDIRDTSVDCITNIIHELEAQHYTINVIKQAELYDSLEISW